MRSEPRKIGHGDSDGVFRNADDETGLRDASQRRRDTDRFRVPQNLRFLVLVFSTLPSPQRPRHQNRQTQKTQRKPRKGKDLLCTVCTAENDH